MGVLFVVLGLGFLVASLIGNIIIWVDAFRNEIWKGVVALLCGLYALYYMFAEFQHPRKALVIVTIFVGAILGYAMLIGGVVSMGPVSQQ